jgi:hypothetical protein
MFTGLSEILYEVRERRSKRPRQARRLLMNKTVYLLSEVHSRLSA